MKICKQFDGVITFFYKKYNMRIPNFVSQLIKQKNYIFCLFHPCDCYVKCEFKKEMKDSIEKIKK